MHSLFHLINSKNVKSFYKHKTIPGNSFLILVNLISPLLIYRFTLISYSSFSFFFYSVCVQCSTKRNGKKIKPQRKIINSNKCWCMSVCVCNERVSVCVVVAA